MHEPVARDHGDRGIRHIGALAPITQTCAGATVNASTVRQHGVRIPHMRQQPDGSLEGTPPWLRAEVRKYLLDLP